MKDDDLKHLLGKIQPPEDEAAKTRALNAAVSAFEAEQKKNAENRQGSDMWSRLMSAITHKTMGDLTMKKAYVALGTVALATAAVGLVMTQSANDIIPRQLTTSPLTSGDEAEITESEAGIVGNVAPTAPSIAPKPALMEKRATSQMMPKSESFAKADSNLMHHSMDAASSPVVGQAMRVAEPIPQPGYQDFGRDEFEKIDENPVKVTKEEPVSTFSVDVDTASYAVVRSALNSGYLPPKDAVRIEEMVNYFDYDYELPTSREEPFKPTVALYDTPWNSDTMLMHVGIKGHELPADTPKPRSNLVFLLDVSGSMNSQDKLPLLKNAFRMLVDTLQPEDTVAIVVYAGAAGTVLEPTSVSEKGKIFAALDNLRAGGSTAGGEGIRQAYALAEANFNKDGINRVLLATDGDFNVGITDDEQLQDLIERKRDTGIYLSVLGFGRGNYNDALMQRLAQNGNGNASYIDTLNEARKVLVDEATSTLYPIAGDVKIQVEFNPNQIAEYRLIGYETRLLNREDFNNDAVDAGDIGAGHTVTALYELTPVGSKAQLVDDLRYGEEKDESTAAEQTDEIAFLKMRYKLPGEDKSQLITRPITLADKQAIGDTSDDVRFAASVAAFGQLLRNASYVGDYGFDDVLELATPARGDDRFGYRSEFLNLVRLAKTAQDQQAQPDGTRRQPQPMTR